MAKPGANNLITDVPGIRVGQAEDVSVRTGATVILPDDPVVAAVCVAGGGPGTRETDLLAGGTLVDAVDAIVLAGGSAFGLAAADPLAGRGPTVLHGGPGTTAKAEVDTVNLMSARTDPTNGAGEPAYYGDFENTVGNPDWNDWTA